MFHGQFELDPSLSSLNTVGTALLWTLQLRRGPAFTAEVEAAWSKVDAALASVMIEAANAAVAS
jgi:hemoglobin-like flavoprotein